MSRRRRLLLMASVPAVVLAGLLAFLAATGAGLRWGVGVATRVVPGLTVAGVEGRLIGPLTLRGLRYDHAGVVLAVQQVSLDWRPAALLAGRVHVLELSVTRGDLQLPAGGKAKSGGGTFAGWRAPFPVQVDALTVDGFRVLPAGAAPVTVTALALGGGLDAHGLRLAHFRLVLPQGRVQAAGRLGLGPGQDSDLRLDWHAALPGHAPLAGTGALQGDGHRLTFTQRLAAPVPAHLALTLQQPFGRLRWTLDLDAPRFALDRLGGTLPGVQVGGSLQGQGDLGHARLTLRGSTDAGAATPYELTADLAAAWSAAGVELQRFQAAVPARGARLDLTGRWQAADGAMDLKGDWQGFSWPLAGTAQVESPQGRFALQGTVDRYTLTLGAATAGPGLPAVDWRVAGQGDRTSLHLATLEAKLLNGSVAGSGSLTWKPQPRWDLALSARDLDPGVAWPDWPGRLGARVAVRGGMTAAGLLALQAQVVDLAGTLRAHPVAGAADLAVDGSRVDLHTLHVTAGAAVLNAAGHVGRTWGVDWKIDAPRLQTLLPGYRGRLTASGRVMGPRALPRAVVKLAAGGLTGGGWRIGDLTGDGDVSLAAGSDSRLVVHARDLVAGGRTLARVDLTAAGRPGDHHATLTATGPDTSLDLALTGAWDGHTWSGRLARADFTLPEAGAWRLAAPVQIQAGTANARLPQACWQGGKARLCVDGERTAAGWQARGDGRDLDLALLDHWLPAGVHLAGTADAQFAAAGGGKGPLSAHGSVTLPPGTVAYPVAGAAPASVAYGGGTARVTLDGKGVQAAADLTLAGQDRLVLALRLPGYVPGRDPARQPVAGSLKVHLARLDLVGPFISGADDLKGTVDGDLALAGTVAAPAVKGDLNLTGGGAVLPALGITVKDAAVRATADGTGVFHLDGRAHSGDGTLALTGDLRLPATGPWQAGLKVTGDRVLVADIPQARVVVSPDITASLAPGRADVQGTVTVPEAHLAPRDLSSAVTPSGDVVVTGNGAPPPSPWKVNAKVRLVLGDKVDVDAFGLTGRVTGDLLAVAPPGQVATGQGELQVMDGTYSAYGQKLAIKTGRLVFAGGPIDNPGLDIRAERVTGDVTAGLTVRGTLHVPVLSLYSSPAMGQSDQLSYLLLGRPMQGASSADGALLYKAASALGLKGGDLLAKRIGAAFGLSTVSVESGATLQDTALVLGKYLSPRLYVDYSMGLFAAVNRLRIRYQMSTRWALQTETGAQSGADLLYTLER